MPFRTISFCSFYPPNSERSPGLSGDAAADRSEIKTNKAARALPRVESSSSQTVLRRRYSRPGSGEAHGQQHVQAGAAFDGARPAVSEPPREDLAVDVLLGSHGPAGWASARSDAVRRGGESSSG